MKKTQSPWGNYGTEPTIDGRARITFDPIGKNRHTIRSMPTDPEMAQERAELFAAEDWSDYGAGKNAPRKRREFVDAQS